MTRFAANLSMMFHEHEFMDRFAAAAKAGFRGVEYLFPYEFATGDLANELARTQLQQVLFNAPPGNWDAGERGLASLAGREQEFDRGIEAALDCAQALSCPRIHVMAGLRDAAVPFRQQRAQYVAGLTRAAAQAGNRSVDLLIEPINAGDMPGYFLDDFALALEILQELEASLPGAIGLQFDIYHCQVIHGDVVGWLERCSHFTRHLQIAGTPDRHEPDAGDLPLADILASVAELHPDLWIGCEYRPAGHTQDGLAWLSGRL